MAKKISHDDISVPDPFKYITEGGAAAVAVVADVRAAIEDLLRATKVSAKNNLFENFRDVQAASEHLNTAKKASEELLKVDKQLVVAHANLAAATAAANRDLEKEVKILNEVKGALNDNIRQLAQYKAEQKQVSDALKTQDNRFKNGIITQREYEEATRGLLKQQAELKIAASALNQTINAQIKGNIAADGSMDALAQNLGQLKAAYRALNEEERNNVEIGGRLLKAIEEEDAKIKALDASIGNFQRNVGNYGNAFSGAFDALTNEIKQVQAEILELDAAGQPFDHLKKKEQALLSVQKQITKEYKTTSQMSRAFQDATRKLGVELGHASKTFVEFKNQVGEGVDALNDINDSIKLAASDTRGLDRMISAAQGIAGAFGVAEGAAALFGDESEELQKTFVKLTAVTTILNGLQGIQAELKNKDSIATKVQIGLQKAYTTVIGTSVGALKAFRLALIATGVGAFVVLLGLLIANWDRIKSLLSIGVNPATKKLAEETTKAAEASREALEMFDLEERKLRALGSAELDIIAIRKDKTKQYLLDTEEQLKAQEKILTETIKNRATWKSLGFNILGTSDEDVEEARKTLKEVTKMREELAVSLIELDKQAGDELVNQARLLEDLRLEAMAEGMDKQIQAERVRYERQIEELGTNYEALTQAGIIYENNIAKIKKEFAEKDLEENFKYRELVVANMKEGTNKLIAAENLANDRRKVELKGNYRALQQLEIQHQQNLTKIMVDEANLRLKLLDEVKDLEIEALTDETERELSQAYLAKERRKKALEEQYKDVAGAQEALQRALSLIDKNYNDQANKTREERAKTENDKRFEDAQAAIQYKEDLAAALLEQERANFKTEEDFEKYKAQKLREIKIAAIQEQLKLIEGMQGAEMELLRQQLKGQLAMLQAETKAATDATGAEAKKKNAENLNKLATETDKFFDRQAKKREDALNKELESSKKRQEDLRQLALSGNKDAQASIAAEDKRQAEIEQARQKALQKQKRRELGLAAINTYNAKVQSGDKNALGNTLKDLTLLSAAVAALPLFYEGTEDTGPGGNLDSKGGKLAVIHPNERIFSADDNKKFAGMANSEAAKVMEAYNNGMLVSATRVPDFSTGQSTAVIEMLENKLSKIEEGIKSLPTYDAHVDTVKQIVIEQWKSLNNTKKKTTRIGGIWDK